MDDLIRDDGRIRKCPSNMAKMGYIRSFVAFFGYRKAFNDIQWGDILEVLASLVQVLIFIIIFPVMPLVQCFFSVRKAKQEVARERAEKETRAL